MSEQNKAIVRRMVEEVWNKGNLDLLGQLVAENHVSYGAGRFPGEIRGVKELRRFTAMMRTAFPDLHGTVEDIVAEGNKVAYRVKSTGTHKGPLPGIAPSGKTISQSVTGIARIEGGKIAETIENGDMLGFLQQLGVVPSLGY